MPNEFAHIELALIVSSTTNPRKNFSADKLTELAESIKASGVHQPVLVRTLPGRRVEETSWHSEPGRQLTRRAVRPTYELVCGERRWRASQQAGAATIPAMIRDLTDAQVLEIQIIENLQRDDLTGLEEAEGYEALMQHSSLTADQVAEKIGKSRSYVYARLKLLDLSVECKQAMRAGSIDASRALLIARIPDGKLQLKALEFATKPEYNGDVASVRRLQEWLKQNVMLRLEHAPFKITDARLVEAAGSCKDCPKRTGANPDLFADVDGADICTDPGCYRGKEEAHRAVMVKKAEAKGLRLVEGKEAQAICNQYNSRLKGYLPLSQVREDAPTFSMEGGAKAATLRDLLGKDAPNPVLIENPFTKELIEAVPAEEAEAMLLTKGLIKSTKAQAETESEIEYLQDRLKGQVERARQQARYDAVQAAIRASKKPAQLITADLLRAWLETVLGDYIEPEDMADMLGMTLADNVDACDAVARHVRACPGADLFKALAVFMLMEDRPRPMAGANKPLVLTTLINELGVDSSTQEKEAAAAVKAKVAEQIKTLKAELKPGTPAQDPAAPASAARRKVGAGGQGAKAPARAAKVSAEEAKQGIAAAMQGLEGAASANAVAPPAAPGGGTPADPLLAKAIDAITKAQKASVRLLKTELGVGTTKALELMASLEAAGKVSACDERGAREVLVAA